MHDALSAADAASHIYLMCRELEAIATEAGHLLLARRLGAAREAAAEALREVSRPDAQEGGEKAAEGDAA